VLLFSAFFPLNDRTPFDQRAASEGRGTHTHTDDTDVRGGHAAPSRIPPSSRCHSQGATQNPSFLRCAEEDGPPAGPVGVQKLTQGKYGEKGASGGGARTPTIKREA